MRKSTKRLRRDKPHILLGGHTKLWVCYNAYECGHNSDSVVQAHLWVYNRNEKEGRVYHGG